MACLLMQILNVKTLILGKLLHGIFVTVVHIANVKMINETVPHNLIGPYGSLIAIEITTGYMLTCVFGVGFPEGDYNPDLPRTGQNLEAYEANVDNEFWRFMLAFPIFMNLIMLSVFFVSIRTDSIMFNLSKKDSNAALYLIDRVYENSESREAILENLKSQVQEKPKSTESTCEALFGYRNRKTTLYMSIFTALN